MQCIVKELKPSQQKFIQILEYHIIQNYSNFKIPCFKPKNFLFNITAATTTRKFGRHH